MCLISLKEFAHKTGRPISTVYSRVTEFKIQPVSTRTLESAALYDLDELKARNIGSSRPRLKTVPVVRKHCKGSSKRKDIIKDEPPLGAFVAPRNYNCPEYISCLDAAAYSNDSLKCSGCINEKASIKSLDIDFTETTREMSGSTVYRMPFK